MHDEKQEMLFVVEPYQSHAEQWTRLQIKWFASLLPGNTKRLFVSIGR